MWEKRYLSNEDLFQSAMEYESNLICKLSMEIMNYYDLADEARDENEEFNMFYAICMAVRYIGTLQDDNIDERLKTINAMHKTLIDLEEELESEVY